MPTRNAPCTVEIPSAATDVSSTFPDLAVLLLDDRGEVAAISKEARVLLGITPDHLALPSALLAQIRDALHSGDSTASKELTLESAFGQTVSVDVTVQRLVAGGANRIAVILSAARRTPEGELHRLHRLASAGTLFASMAHEIKNALVAGKTFLDLLLEKHQDAELAEIVRREVDRIDALAGQMLRFTRPPKYARTRVQVHQLLDLTIRLIEPQFKNKSVLIQRSFSAESDVIEASEQQLEQAFLNLLLNSMEAMGQQGQLAISTGITKEVPGRKRTNSTPRFVEIRITDDGGGIAPQYLSRLFEPFFTTKKNGTGLGLAITRKIIREHGGQISAESEPNQGATFRILLPLA